MNIEFNKIGRDEPQRPINKVQEIIKNIEKTPASKNQATSESINDEDVNDWFDSLKPVTAQEMERIAIELQNALEEFYAESIGSSIYKRIESSPSLDKLVKGRDKKFPTS